MLAAVIASIPYNIVIAHLRGGELTYGAFDDAIRHSITKFSHIHFCTTKDHAKRINQMGEENYRIKIVFIYDQVFYQYATNFFTRAKYIIWPFDFQIKASKFNKHISNC